MRAMSYHKKWMKEFLYLLIEAKLDLCWSCYAAVNTVDKDLLKLMRKAGCWNIFYGYETAIDDLAKNVETNIYEQLHGERRNIQM